MNFNGLAIFHNLDFIHRCAWLVGVKIKKSWRWAKFLLKALIFIPDFWLIAFQTFSRHFQHSEDQHVTFPILNYSKSLQTEKWVLNFLRLFYLVQDNLWDKTTLAYCKLISITIKKEIASDFCISHNEVFENDAIHTLQ